MTYLPSMYLRNSSNDLLSMYLFTLIHSALCLVILTRFWVKVVAMVPRFNFQMLGRRKYLSLKVPIEMFQINMYMKKVKLLKSPMSELLCKVCKQRLDFLCAWHIIHLQIFVEGINESINFWEYDREKCLHCTRRKMR